LRNNIPFLFLESLWQEIKSKLVVSYLVLVPIGLVPFLQTDLNLVKSNPMIVKMFYSIVSDAELLDARALYFTDPQNIQDYCTHV